MPWQIGLGYNIIISASSAVITAQRQSDGSGTNRKGELQRRWTEEPGLRMFVSAGTAADKKYDTSSYIKERKEGSRAVRVDKHSAGPQTEHLSPLALTDNRRGVVLYTEQSHGDPVASHTRTQKKKQWLTH